MWIELEKPALNPQQVQDAINAAIQDYVNSHPASPPVTSKQILCNLTDAPMQIRFTINNNPYGDPETLQKGEAKVYSSDMFTGTSLAAEYMLTCSALPSVLSHNRIIGAERGDVGITDNYGTLNVWLPYVNKYTLNDNQLHETVQIFYTVPVVGVPPASNANIGVYRAINTTANYLTVAVLDSNGDVKENIGIQSGETAEIKFSQISSTDVITIRSNYNSAFHEIYNASGVVSNYVSSTDTTADVTSAPVFNTDDKTSYLGVWELKTLTASFFDNRVVVSLFQTPPSNL